MAHRPAVPDAGAVPQRPDPPRFVVLDEDDEDDASPVGHPTDGAVRPVPARRLTGLLIGVARHRRARWAAGGLAGLAAAAVMASALTSEHAARQSATPILTPVRIPVLSAAGKPWPTSPAACDSVRYLPLVTADPLRERTGSRVQLGGQSVHTVDLDARSSVATPGLELSSRQFVTQLVPGRDASYALVQTCESTDTSSVMRVSRDATTIVLSSDRHIDSLLGDGRGGVWAAEVADIPTDGPILLRRLDAPGAVRLPAGLSPIAIYGHQLIGLTAAADQRPSESSGALVSYDLAGRRSGRTIGTASSLAVDRGVLLWLDRPCTASADCQLHRLDLASGAVTVRGYRLPVQTSIVGGVLSPDGRTLAFPLARLYEGPHIDDAGFGPPLDVAVLHLDSGQLETVGGLTLPPTELPGLTFTGNGNWLVIVVNQGRGTELLLWRPGLPRLLRPGLRIEDQMLQSPPVLALPR